MVAGAGLAIGGSLRRRGDDGRLPGRIPEFLTPIDEFYRYTNGPEPAPVAASEARLRVGPLEAPREIGWAGLLPLATRRIPRTLQCDGNGYIDGGRAGCQQVAPPRPANWGWRYGGIGTAEWDVVGVGDLLAAQGLTPPPGAAPWLRIRGRDGYDRHFPGEVLGDPDFCLAVGMNGQPLPHGHGAPARLLAPGQYGAANVKWVQAIEWGERQEAHPFDDGPESWYPIKPIAFATAPAGPDVGPEVELGGVAFAGQYGVKTVLLWEDPSEAWEAELLDPGRPNVWSRWRSRVVLAPGRHRITIACVDTQGSYSRAQEPYGDAEGYGGYHEIRLRVG